MEDTKESRPSRHNRADTDMNLQRVQPHAQGLHRSVPNGFLEVKEVDLCP